MGLLFFGGGSTWSRSAVELRVAGLIHLTHAAFADLGGDVIGAEGGTGVQGHRQFVGTRSSSC